MEGHRAFAGRSIPNLLDRWAPTRWPRLRVFEFRPASKVEETRASAWDFAVETGQNSENPRGTPRRTTGGKGVSSTVGGDSLNRLGQKRRPNREGVLLGWSFARRRVGVVGRRAELKGNLHFGHKAGHPREKSLKPHSAVNYIFAAGRLKFHGGLL